MLKNIKTSEGKRLKNLVAKFKQSRLFKMYVAMVLALSTCTVGVFAATEPPPPSLTLDFDFTQMFSWAQNILNVMMPVVYITMGVALAFVIIKALKSAFGY
jgi:hypothetical protein